MEKWKIHVILIIQNNNNGNNINKGPTSAGVAKVMFIITGLILLILAQLDSLHFQNT